MTNGETREARTDAVRALEAEFGELISRMRRVLADNAQRVSPGMLPGAYKVFTTIVRRESVTLSNLADSLMADKGQISHDGFPQDRKRALTAEFPSATWNFYAENVAMLSNSGTDATKIAEQFVEMWWKSPGHKANMVGNHKKIGVGVSKVGNKYYATQIFH